MQTFNIVCKDSNGMRLHGTVRQISHTDYEVFVKEKGVILHCTADEHGVFACRLHTKGNLTWVEGISREVAERINKNAVAF